ncbi:hypothetical protein ACLB1M_04975 [Escherichia coli]
MQEEYDLKSRQRLYRFPLAAAPGRAAGWKGHPNRFSSIQKFDVTQLNNTLRGVFFHQRRAGAGRRGSRSRASGSVLSGL